MGIEALPDFTVRAIGATQVLNDPSSLVKELIDNALDAQSTSISVEIHSNTLDSIHVRDNGHGIPAEDRQLVARPHCTSKISGENDLKAIGGLSLGFRGEALASAAEMSGSLTISTRVEGEEVATALKINRQGIVVGQDRASLPVGTTVKIADFIKAHPVRRQAALKNAEKTLAKIKQTLKAYAFARPHVRLSLRVLKARNDKGNWMYAPKAGGNAEDAAFKIVGAACAQQCTWSVIEDDGYDLYAFLPRPDAEVSKFSNIGAFISIDARPVSTARATPKQFLKIFREAIRKINSKFDGTKEPFLYLSIRCPSGSYDANVEPAKDDVLFEDPDMVIAMVRRLFDALYPCSERENQPMPEPVREDAVPTASPRIDDEDFIASLEAAAASSSSPQLATPWTPLPTDQNVPEPTTYHDAGDLDDEPRQAFRGNMYGCDDEDVEFLDDRFPNSRTEDAIAELRRAHKDVNVSNPWILAKVNSTVRQRPAFTHGDDEVLTSGNGVQQPDRSMAQSDFSEEMTPGLPTPRCSSPVKSVGTPRPFVESSSTPRVNNSRFIGERTLPPPGPTIAAPSLSPVDDNEVASGPRYGQTPAYNYGLALQARDQTRDTALHSIPDTSSRHRQNPKRTLRQGQLNTPFKSPVRNEPPREKVWFDHLERLDQGRSPKRQYQPREKNDVVAQGELGDLLDDPRALTPPRRNRDMREYLTPRDHFRNEPIADISGPRRHWQQATNNNTENVLQQGDQTNGNSSGIFGARGFIPASKLAALDTRFGPVKPDATRPTKRRKTDDSQVLREISLNAPASEATLKDGNQANVGSRSASARPRTADGSLEKARRRKSSRLPLERVPKGKGTHSLVLELPTSLRDVSVLASKLDQESSLVAWNEPAVDPYTVSGTAFGAEALESVTVRLRDLLAKHVPGGELTQNLSMAVRNALAAHAHGAVEMEA